MKRKIAITAALWLLLSAAACGDDIQSASVQQTTESATTVATTVEGNPIEALDESEYEIFDNFLKGVGRFDNPSEVRFIDVMDEKFVYENGKGGIWHSGWFITLNVVSPCELLSLESYGNELEGNQYLLYNYVNRDDPSHLCCNDVYEGYIMPYGIVDQGTENTESTARLNRALEYY